MSEKCFVCAKVCRRKSNKVTCLGCKMVAHTECVGLGRKELKYLNESWRCKQCIEGIGGSGGMQERQLIAHASDRGTVSTVAIIPSAPSLDVMSELTLFRREQGEQNRDVGKSLEVMHNKVNDMNLGLDSHSRTIAHLQSMVANLQTENEQLKMDVSELKLRVNDSQSQSQSQCECDEYSRRNTIEMQSVPYMERIQGRGSESPQQCQQSCSVCSSFSQVLAAICTNECIDACVRFKNRLKKCVQCFLIGLLEILAKCVL